MSEHLIIKEARCSFPRLYGHEEKEGQDYGPGITVVLEKVKHAATIEKIKDAIREAIAANPKLKSNPPKGEKLCLRRPERAELQYMDGNVVLKAGSPKPPVVLHPDGKTLMTPGTDRVYSGCYVNIKVEIWGQANKHGRRVNAKLLAVQYVPKAAESFDGTYVSPEQAMEGFGSLDDDETLSGPGVGESMGEVLSDDPLNDDDLGI